MNVADDAMAATVKPADLLLSQWRLILFDSRSLFGSHKSLRPDARGR